MGPRATIVAAVLMLAATVQADVFNLGGVRDPATGAWTGVASLEMVAVGDAGNAADMRYNLDLRPEGYGAVGYAYKIGKYEVTVGQYTAFLNAVATTDTYGLYNTNMWLDTNFGCKIQRNGAPGTYTYSVASDCANRPVNYVSWGDSARFANWLHNGQPIGGQGLATTEDGAYFLNGATNNAALLTVTRKANAKWAIPTEDEWYKAAYYKGGSTNAGYWDYPTRSNTAPGNDMADPSGNNANIYVPYLDDRYPIDSGHYTTVVGEFQNSASPYGTFDQAGNFWERNEANVGGSYRGLRGGTFYNYSSRGKAALAAFRNYGYPANEGCDTGFRVVQAPEPTSMSLLAFCGLAIVRWRR